MEVRSLAPGQAQNYQTKIRDYKLDLQNLKDRLKGAARGGPSAGGTRRDLVKSLLFVFVFLFF